MTTNRPRPDDLIVVDHSSWPRLPSPGLLQIVACGCWFRAGEHLAVAPRAFVHQCPPPATSISQQRVLPRLRVRDSSLRVVMRSLLFDLLPVDIDHHAGGSASPSAVVWRLPHLPDLDQVRAAVSDPPLFGDDDSRSIHPIVRRIVQRHGDVGCSARQIVRRVISQLTHGPSTFRALPRAERRWLIDDCMRQHQLDQELHCQLPIGATRVASRAATLAGSDVVRLMRRSEVTIDQLAFRLGVPPSRVRHVRRQGLQDSLVVRDWLEAITGEDPGPLPERFRITHVCEEECCGWCGYPLSVGDDGFLYLHEVFCSPSCARRSRGW